MAILTSAQLQGAGSSNQTLSKTFPYVLTCINPGDSSYLFLESNRDRNGTYNTLGTGFGNPNASGSWVDNQVGGLVTDGKYIMGCVVPPGTSSIVFTQLSLI
jgi:hypothetical protein